MAEFKRVIQRTTNSERIESGVAQLEVNEFCIVEDGEEVIYKNKDGKYISISKDKYTVGTIEELKSSKKYKVGDVVQVLGYYDPGDGGGHPRKACLEDDGSGDYGNGIWWNIVHNGEVNILWFGAKGDGLADDTNSIQKAIDVGEKINLPKGKFIISKTIIVRNGKNIQGLGILDTFVENCTNSICFNIVNNKTQIRNMYISYSDINNSGVALVFASDTEHIQMNVIENLMICDSKIAIKNNNNKTIFSSIFKNIHIKRFLDSAINIGGNTFGTTGNTFENIYIDNYLENGERRHTPNVIILTGHTETSFNQLNLENLSADICINLIGSRGIYINGLHMEKVNLRESSLSKNFIFNISGSSFILDNCIWSFSDITTDKEVVFLKNYGRCNVKMSNINIISSVIFTNIENILIDNSSITLDNNTHIYVDMFYNYSNSTFYNHDQYRNIKRLNDKQSVDIAINVDRSTSFEEFISNNSHYDAIFNYVSITSATGYPRPNTQHNNTAFLFGGAIGDYVISVPKQANLNEVYINKKISATDWSGWKLISYSNEILSFDTPYYREKMFQQNIYQDFTKYLDAKHEYDYQQREIEKQKQLAYEEALKENPNLTYEEFLENLPILLHVLEEPQPSEALIAFKEKYIG